MAKKVTGATGPNGENLIPVEMAVYQGAAASIKEGMLVKVNGSQPGYVTLGADSDVKTAKFLGIAACDSDETATANGTVLVLRSAPYIRGFMKATTPGNLAATVKNTCCSLDVSSSDFTVDENDTTNGFIRILDYDNTTDGNCFVEINVDGGYGV